MRFICFARKGDEVRREEFSDAATAEKWAAGMRRAHWLVTVVGA